MEHKIDEFVYKANPNEWLEVSDELNHSIEIIIENNSSIYFKSDTWNGIPIKKSMASRSVFLLMGFAIENIIKGVLIFDKPELINTGKIKNEIKTHNLQSLIEKTETIELDESEQDFINVLSEAIPDWGRYPSPLTFQNLKDEVLYFQNSYVIYNSLRTKIRTILIDKLKTGWVSGRENRRTDVQIIEMSKK